MRVVLDTNLIVRAAGERAGLGLDLILLAITEPHVLLISHSLYAEIRRVMHYPRLRALHRLDEAGIQSFLDDLLVVTEQIALAGHPHAGPLVGLDPTDDPILLTAVAGRADAIGTNNRHFFAADVVGFAQSHGIRILRDAELIVELRKI
ncbi:MAG TPA: putative toxin-antitoxin system toxin component, PIN family [Pirellulales bacterium]|nr:putative toxin-antitoxin system toxin component, PIN family [Pirellulales bacterium]